MYAACKSRSVKRHADVQNFDRKLTSSQSCTYALKIRPKFPDMWPCQQISTRLHEIDAGKKDVNISFRSRTEKTAISVHAS